MDYPFIPRTRADAGSSPPPPRVTDNVQMRFWQRRFVTAALACIGVVAAYLVADRRGVLPLVLIFVVGLAIGFGTRGGWLVSMVGVILAGAVFGAVKALGDSVPGAELIRFYAGETLLFGMTIFTPGYLFGAAARLSPKVPQESALESGEPITAADSQRRMTSTAMSFLGCAILIGVGLVFGYILWRLRETGGY